MPEPFLGEIRLFSFGVVPRGWLACEGQLLPLNSNQALFSILGVAYGGNGTTNFQLPDLRGRTPVHVNYIDGNQPATPYGKPGGEATHVLTLPEMPLHTHLVKASAGVDGTPQSSPVNGLWRDSSNLNLFAATATAGATFSPAALPTAGGNQPHSNQQPALSLHYCIAISGIYPSRN